MPGNKQRPKRKTKWYEGCDCTICELPSLGLGLVSAILLASSRPTRAGAGSRTGSAVTAAIRGYRRLSPRLPTRCRFTPTCSAYGLEAVQRYGAGEGLRLTTRRLRRCRPGVGYGTADPVP